jgi:two-component system sensor histidine kinase YesM
MKLRKVSYKIFLGFLVVSSMILLVMSLVVKTSYARSLKDNEIFSQIQVSSRTREQFDLILGIIDSNARVIGARPEILRCLTAERPVAERADFSMNVYLQSLREIQPFLGNITIVGAGGQFASSNVSFKPADFENLYRRHTEYFNSGAYKYYFVDVFNAGFSQVNSRDILTGVWPVYDIKSEKLLGQIYLGLNYSIFQELFIMSPVTNNEKIVIADQDGKIVYAYPAFESFETILADYPQLLSSTTAVFEGRFFGMDGFIVSDTFRSLNWRFIRIIDAEHMIGDTRRTQYFFDMVFVFSIIFSILFSVLMSRILTRPVKLLLEACNRIERGDMGFRVAISSPDEMGQLGHTFNLVMDRINADMERERIEQQRQSELKLEILRSQINPHFLYNTLDSIRFLANLQEVHNIASMSSSLICLLRYNLSSDTLATLGEEMGSIRNYVEIQKFRYGDIFEFKTAIAAGTEGCVISRFVLQPLVENCLIHGFEDIENGGEIEIRSELEYETLKLEVIDNGRGIDGERLEKINRGLDRNTGRGSIGINNIRERIKLQFGERASLIYTSGDGAGTHAILRFPLTRMDLKKL